VKIFRTHCRSNFWYLARDSDPWIYEEDLRQRMYGYGFSYARRLTLKAWGKWMQWKNFKEFKKSNGMRYEFSMQSTLIAVHEVCFFSRRNAMAFERVMPGLSRSMPLVMRTWPPKPNAMRFLRSFYATWLCKEFCFYLRFFCKTGRTRSSMFR